MLESLEMRNRFCYWSMERESHFEECIARIAEDAKRAHRKINKGDTFDLPL